MKPFKSHKRNFGGLDAEATAGLVSAASDIAVVLDKKGIVRDVACESKALTSIGCEGWLGKAWVDTVSVDSRTKVEELLASALQGSKATGRQVNHPSSGGGDVPVSYSVFPLGEQGQFLALGRDLSTVAELQRKIVNRDQEVDRDLARAHATETRYRVLFQLTSEAVLIADPATMKIIEANPAAVELLSNGSKRLVGRNLQDLIDTADRPAFDGLIASVRNSPRAEDIDVRLSDSTAPVRAAASLFRQDGTGFLLVRFWAKHANDQDAGAISSRSLALGVLDKIPDALVVCDNDRRIMFANIAFLDFAELGSGEQARGQPIDRWLGRVNVDTDILFASLRENGSVRRYATAVHGEFGKIQDVEISAVRVEHGQQLCVGLSMRKVQREPINLVTRRAPVPRSIEQLTDLVGRVPLKELVRETTDIIERMCIEAALELTGDNRASAAEMLGLSRQSLYVKLRRFGLGELGDEMR